jgi:serine-type D-Ala-D-Ala carboxypeptidase/endopeptidase
MENEEKDTKMVTMMLKTTLGVVIFLVVVFCCVFAYIAYTKSQYHRLTDTGDLKARIVKFGEQYMGNRPHSALAIGVIQKGEVFTKFFGQLSKTNRSPPDAETIYEIGPITKVFTALAAAQMVADGKLKWDETVEDVLPDDVTLSESVKPITIKHLATHMAGLPRLPDNFAFEPDKFDNPYVEYGEEELKGFLATYKAKVETGSKVVYSNLGFALLGYLLEERSKSSYEELVAKSVFAPLGLTNSHFIVPVGMTNRMAAGHNPDGGLVPNWDWKTFKSTGAIKSTLNEMLRFVSANMNPDETEIGPLLKECQKLHGQAWSGHMGLGWQLLKTLQGDMDFVWHNGGTGGFVAFIGFDRKNQMGVVMLSSSGDAMKGDFYLDKLAMEILKLGSKISFENAGVVGAKSE